MDMRTIPQMMEAVSNFGYENDGHDFMRMVEKGIRREIRGLNPTM